jgi:predicted transcriptional regulator
MPKPELKARKQELIEWVNQLSDVKTLQKLEKLMKASTEKEDWDELPESYKQSILKGLKDAKAGRFVPASEVRKLFNNGK